MRKVLRLTSSGNAKAVRIARFTDGLVDEAREEVVCEARCGSTDGAQVHVSVVLRVRPTYVAIVLDSA